MTSAELHLQWMAEKIQEQVTVLLETVPYSPAREVAAAKLETMVTFQARAKHALGEPTAPPHDTAPYDGIIFKLNVIRNVVLYGSGSTHGYRESFKRNELGQDEIVPVLNNAIGQFDEARLLIDTLIAELANLRQRQEV